MIEIWSTDPGTKSDIGAWSGKVGHEFLGVLAADGYDRVFVSAASSNRQPAGAPQPAAERSQEPSDDRPRRDRAAAPGDTFVPRILVFSTNNISDPGIDLAGSNHLHYSPGVKVIGLPCTSGIRPSWILHALERGFDGVFVASDGDECAYLPDCAERSSRIVGAGPGAAMRSGGSTPQRLRLAAICSVCAEPFTKHVQQFSVALAALGPATAR